MASGRVPHFHQSVREAIPAYENADNLPDSHDSVIPSSSFPSVCCCRVVNPDGWLSTTLDWLTAKYPPSRLHNFSGVSFRVDKEEQYQGSGQPQPYWLINLGIGALGPHPWQDCMG